MNDAVFIRLLFSEAKANSLRNSVTLTREGLLEGSHVYLAAPDTFRKLSKSPFAYWASDHVRELFDVLPSFEGNGRHACVTNPAGDDRRYFRCFWEVPVDLIGRENRWVPLVKGGEFSRYYSDVHLLVDWDVEEQTYRGFEGTVHRPLKRPASLDYFFRAGITYSTRSQLGFSARILPEGCIFHAKGPANLL